MRTIQHIGLSIGVCTMLLGACSGSKSFAKKGEKLDAAGLYAEAAEMYLQSAQRNQKNVEAKIGLKKTGQMVLNDKLSEFFKQFSMGDTKAEAVNAYLAAQEYADRVQRMGVMLEIPENYKKDFAQVKGEYLVQLYTEGQDLLAKQDFKAAEAKFARIAQLEPGYKDASSLQDIAYLEPLYRSGSAHLEGGRYRSAYNDLEKVLAKNPDYKDAKALRQDALTRGQYSIAVLPFSGAGVSKDVTARVQAYAITALIEVRDPFLKVVDRENIDRILQEQRLGLSGVVDEQTAVSAGKLMGAQAVLMGTVMDYREMPGSLRRSTKDGFESYRVRQLNPETNEYSFVVKYKPVKYVEYFQENKVYASFSYKLVSLETGEVLMSKVVEKETSDQAYYASYDGNKENLVPARNGVVDLNNNARRDLLGLLNASHDLKPMGTLSNDLLRTTTSGMAGALQQHLSSVLP